MEAESRVTVFFFIEDSETLNRKNYWLQNFISALIIEFRCIGWPSIVDEKDCVTDLFQLAVQRRRKASLSSAESPECCKCHLNMNWEIYQFFENVRICCMRICALITHGVENMHVIKHACIPSFKSIHTFGLILLSCMNSCYTIQNNSLHWTWNYWTVHSICI